MSDPVGNSGGGIDWGAIHRRLEKVSEALSRAGSGNGSDMLRSRAQALALPPPGKDVEGERIEILEFLLAGENYAVESSFISETVSLEEFTPLFGVPRFVLGITAVRGRIISIVDLRYFFDLPAAGLSDLNRLIIVSNGSMEFGIAADAIIGMKSLQLRDLQEPLPTMTGIRHEFLSGVTGDRLALLDLGKILADSRLVVHEVG